MVYIPQMAVWSKEPPRQEAYYWWKCDEFDREPEIIFVFEEDGKMMVSDYDEDLLLEELGGLFNGPLIPPM